jgi:peptidoglycan hydrolase-like protein with peptidoglycan-binding domain
VTTTILGFSVVEQWGSPLIGTFLVPGTTAKLGLRKETAPLLLAFARDFDRDVESLLPKQCGGFNPRRIAGSTAWSRHALGVAIDLNWQMHPMGRRDTFSVGDRAIIRKLLDRYVHEGKRLFRWGADFTNNPDDMHFELNVTRAVALEAVDALQTPRKPAPAGGQKPGSRVLREGMRGPDVAFVQRWVGVGDDGRFGPRTKTSVQRYQRMRGITADGVVTAKTWAQMGIKFTG